MTLSANTSRYCMYCGELGGHGSLPCPRAIREFNPYSAPVPSERVPAQWLAPEPIGPKLDRIIELLEELLNRGR